MSCARVPCLLAGAVLAGAVTAGSHPQGLDEVGWPLVSVSVLIDGAPAPLYSAPDGSGRYYVEARTGSRYVVTLANRSGERVGAVLTVDGLNAISGTRDEGRGRMYVLDPWQTTSVQGWRTSLEEVRRFTFVDERRSYASRTGQANGKMGWIEVAVYGERRAYVQSRPHRYDEPPSPYPAEDRESRPRAQAPGAPEASATREAPQARDEAGAAAAGRADNEPKREADASHGRSYPGTGWGERASDRVVLVSFDPEPEPRQRVTLRYEYRPALVALGVLPPRTATSDRLSQRERGEPGFAQPPRW